MIPVASRMLSVPAKPGTNRCLATSPPSGLASRSSKTNEATTTPTRAVIAGLQAAEAPLLQGEDLRRHRRRRSARREQRGPEEQVEAERGADDLGDVAGHRD